MATLCPRCAATSHGRNTTLDLLFRNTTAFVAQGNSLSLEFYGGYYVKRTFLGGELRKLTTEQVRKIIVPGLQQAIEKGPGAHMVTAPDNTQRLEELKQAFEANEKGQFDLGP